MPSPIAHGLAGLALTRIFRFRPLWLARSLKGSPKRSVLLAGAAVFLASIGPDFDFIPGLLIGKPSAFHPSATHSLSATILFGGLTYLVALWRKAHSPVRVSLFLALVYCSHLVLDLLTRTLGTQVGLPFFWPFPVGDVVSPFHLFVYIKRGSTTATFFPSLVNMHNLIAIFREVVLMGLILLAVALARSWRLRLRSEKVGWSREDRGD